MKPHRRRHSPRAAALSILACAALAAPAAADPPSANYEQPSTAKIGDTPADYPGMPAAPAQAADAGPTHAPEAGGFDWPSAAIGAAGAGLLFVVSLGGASVRPRRTRVARGHRWHAGA